MMTEIKPALGDVLIINFKSETVQHYDTDFQEGSIVYTFDQIDPHKYGVLMKFKEYGLLYGMLYLGVVPVLHALDPDDRDYPEHSDLLCLLQIWHEGPTHTAFKYHMFRVFSINGRLQTRGDC